MLVLTFAGTMPNQTLAARPRTVATSAILDAGGEPLTLDLVMAYRGSRSVRGSVSVVVTLPEGASGSVVGSDTGFNGRGYAIGFRTGTNTDRVVVVQVTVPAAHSRVEFEASLSAASGDAFSVPARTNQTVVFDAYTA